MKTPIVDFARKYAESNAVRMHMPGHKGKEILGFEVFDITEINGADELFSPEGIIAESERNAGEIFGCPTFYSTEGSSLCIRTMLCLAVQYAASQGKKPLIAASRNAHRSFMTAAVLLDFQPVWLPDSGCESLLSFNISSEKLYEFLKNSSQLPTAVYITSPDYLGNIADISSVAEICHKFGILLLVDNAHGAYLHFLQSSQHPIMLGADICCDSAHKTLPVLTGGAYLHISPKNSEYFVPRVKNTMAFFASTSPSYLILESLDKCNSLLDTDFSHKLSEISCRVSEIKSRLEKKGYVFCGNEPVKLTLCAKKYGYIGTEIADILNRNGIIHEFADKDHVVLMISYFNSVHEIDKLCEILLDIPQKPEIEDIPRIPHSSCFAVSPRKATLGNSIRLPVSECQGRICAEIAYSCPPAVPIAYCGEIITSEVIECFRYYGISECNVADI